MITPSRHSFTILIQLIIPYYTLHGNFHLLPFQYFINNNNNNDKIVIVASATVTATTAQQPYKSIPRSSEFGLFSSILAEHDYDDDDEDEDEEEDEEEKEATIDKKKFNVSSSRPPPPWNTSPQIDSLGYLKKRYYRTIGEWEKDANIRGKYNYHSRFTKRTMLLSEGDDSKDVRSVVIRQVPGDGNCLFHSIAACLDDVCRRQLYYNANDVGPRRNHEHHRSHRRRQRRKISPSSSRKRNTHHYLQAYSSIEKKMLKDERQRHNKYLQKHHRSRRKRCSTNNKLKLKQSPNNHIRPNRPSAISEWRNLRHHSRTLRTLAVQTLNVTSPHNRSHHSHHYRSNRRLYLQGSENLSTHDLVERAAKPYGISTDEYCRTMNMDRYWGGGPEIVALSNSLRRPVHVYELCVGEIIVTTRNCGTINNNNNNHHPDSSSSSTTSTTTNNKKEFILRRMACFGSPKFDKREALHLLSVDSRFPDIKVGKQLKKGNHFLAILPNTYNCRPYDDDDNYGDGNNDMRSGEGGEDYYYYGDNHEDYCF